MAPPKQARGPAAKPAQAKAAAAGPAKPKAGAGTAGRPAQARPGQPGYGKNGQTRKARDRARARELAEQRATAEPVAAGPPLWLQLTSLALALIGLGVSIYLTIEHYTGNATLACSDKGTINCAAVTTSPESMVFGVFPVAVLGLAFFVAVIPLLTPWAWRSRRREIAMVRLGSMVVGVGFILYLIYVELLQVGAICLWCTSVHVITFLLFVLVAMSAAVYGLVPANDQSAR
jgi:uncharacterized membrane protein